MAVTNCVHSMFADHAIIIEDAMQERGMADDMRRINRGVKETLVDR